MRQDQRGPLHLLDDIRHRKRLARARGTEECLVLLAAGNALHQLFDRRRLIASGLELRNELEREVFHKTKQYTASKHLFQRNAAKTHSVKRQIYLPFCASGTEIPLLYGTRVAMAPSNTAEFHARKKCMESITPGNDRIP